MFAMFAVFGFHTQKRWVSKNILYPANIANIIIIHINNNIEYRYSPPPPVFILFAV